MPPEAQTRIVLSPIATPLPLTFVGLLLASTILSALELGWIPRAQAQGAGWVLLALPVPLQLVAAVFGFRARSATAATGSSVLAAAWLAIALTLIHVPPGVSTPSRSVGILSFAVAAALLVPAAADAVGQSYLPAAVLVLTAGRFVVTGIAAFAASPGLKEGAGVVGLAVATSAFYAAAALELEGARQRALLPTFRGPRATEALAAPFLRQLEAIEHEAGIRKSL